MQKFNNALILLCFSLLLMFPVSCDESDSSTSKKNGKIEFAFSKPDAGIGGRSQENLSSLLISVKNANGEIIYDHKSLTLYEFEGEYLSEPISLETGQFLLTEFIVLDENNNAVYATPLESSELDYLVSDPLPIEFTINKDETTKIIPEVIGVEGHSSVDFGYATFSFDTIPTLTFYIGILAYDEETKNFELTPANVKITSSDDTLFNKELSAATAAITVKEKTTLYNLLVTKPGYVSFQKAFTAEQLETYISTSSLTVTLINGSIAEGLIAHYPFSGNAKDSTFNGHDGIIHGAMLTTDRDGQINSSYKFDGVDDYISVPHHDDLNLAGNFSISLWAEISSSQVPHEGINDILRKWNGDHYGYPFSIAYLNSVAPDQFEDKLLFTRYDGQVCANNPTSYSSTITNDTFQHIVLIKEGSVLRQYLNNQLIAEFADDTSCDTGNSADMTIGARGNLVRFFKGKIDDIRIYGRALSSSEVANLNAE